MIGETVVVEVPETVGHDPYGAPITECEEVEVSHVLVAPGAQRDLGEDRPEGYDILYTLYFPKAFAGTLSNTRIKVCGRWLRVIGFSDHYPDCPTQWDMVVEVGEANG